MALYLGNVKIAGGGSGSGNYTPVDDVLPSNKALQALEAKIVELQARIQALEDQLKK